MEAARENDRPSTITRGFLEQLSLEQILAINDFVEKLLEAQERHPGKGHRRMKNAR